MINPLRKTRIHRRRRITNDLGLNVPSFKGRMKLIKEYNVALPTPGDKSAPFSQNANTPTATATAPRPGVPLPGSQKSSGGKIQLAHSLEGVEQSASLTTGQHPAVVEYVESISASTGAQGIQFHLRFTDFVINDQPTPNNGRRSKHTVYVTPKAMWKVKNSFCAVGQCDAIDEFDADEAQNVMVLVVVTEESWTPPATDMNPNPIERKSTKCDTILAWPDEHGGPGTKLVP